MLNLLDGLVLVNRLNVHGHDFAGIHIQKILQQLVADVGGGDLQIAHSAIETAHTEDTAPREGKGGGRNVVLNGKAGRRQLFPIEAEFLAISHVEHTVHQLEPFFAVQKLGGNA